jgi:hypothetical protein
MLRLGVGGDYLSILCRCRDSGRMILAHSQRGFVIYIEIWLGVLPKAQSEDIAKRRKGILNATTRRK